MSVGETKTTEENRIVGGGGGAHVQSNVSAASVEQNMIRIWA